MVLLTVPAAGEGGPGWPSALPLLPHPSELIIGLIAFGLMYWIFSSKIVPNMEKMFSERKEAIVGDMTRAERAMDEANDLKRQYEAQLSDARTEAARVREEAREQGAAIIAEMRDQAQAESARILESTQRQIDAERAQAMNQLKGDVGRLSTDLASRIVGESLHDEARQKGIVERFISDLEAGQLASGRGEPVRDALPKEVDF